MAEKMTGRAAKYRADLPYPKVEGLKRNRRYAKIILNDYTGKISEMSAVGQYVYQHILLEEEYPEVSEALLGIAIAEMHHLELLGQVVLQLGVLPKYRTLRNERPLWWTPAGLNYERTLQYILPANVEAEEAAIYEYQNTLRMVKEPQIAALIQRIILDEELHIDIFNALIKKYL
jgi:bacterioferritin